MSAWNEYTEDQIKDTGPEDTVFSKSLDGRILGVAAPYGEPDAVALNLTTYRLGAYGKWIRLSNTEVYLEPDELDELADRLTKHADRIRKNNNDDKEVRR